jgi:hypothetical protein
MNTTDTRKFATELVSQQIAIHNQQIEGFKAEIQNLEARLEAVTMMRGALLALLSDQKAVDGGAPSSIPPASNPAVELPVTKAPATKTNGTGAGHKVGTAVTGFAEAVRTILKDHPKGLRPSVLAKQMQVRGSSALYTGKAPFTVRVGSELRRLSRSGRVERRNGRYYLAQEERRP